jgi:hypothetical protein
MDTRNGDWLEFASSWTRYDTQHCLAVLASQILQPAESHARWLIIDTIELFSCVA